VKLLIDDFNQDEFKKRLKYLFDQSPLNKKDIQRNIGVSYTSVQNWFKYGEISKENIKKLSDLFKCDYIWLLTGHEGVKENIPAYEIKSWHEKTDLDNDDILINVYNVSLSAGNGDSIPEFIETKKKLSYSMDWIDKKGFKPNDLKAMPVRGDSMSNTLNDGDLVLIDTSQKQIIDGSIYALIIANEAKIKRLKKTFNGGLVIISDNNSDLYHDEILQPSDLQFIHIIGKAVHKSGDL
jgi:phage repressor protein C with HTH and peptisase S24 domain